MKSANNRKKLAYFRAENLHSQLFLLPLHRFSATILIYMQNSQQITPIEIQEFFRNKRRNKLQWYVLYVTSQHERKIADAITQKEESIYLQKQMNGTLTDSDYKIKTYVPTQTVKRKWSDRIVKKKVVIIPGVIFLRMKLIDKQRIYIDSNIKSFLFNKEKKEPEPIPDWQMYQFQQLVNENTDLSMETPELGDTVKITVGKFEGFVGMLIRKNNGETKFQIRIAGLAFPINISKDDVIKVEPGTLPDLPDEIWH